MCTENGAEMLNCEGLIAGRAAGWRVAPGTVVSHRRIAMSLTRRDFLKSVAAGAAVAPWIGSSRLFAADAVEGASRQHRRERDGLRRHHELLEAPGLRARRRGRRGSRAHGASEGAVPAGAHLPGLARAAEEGAREPGLDQRVHARSHACADCDGGHADGPARVRAEAARGHDPRNPQARRVRALARHRVADGDPDFVGAITAGVRDDDSRRRDRQDHRGPHLL